MRYSRQYIQYGELVFDEVLADASQTTFKTFEQEYGFTHGSYFPQKRKGGLLRAGSVTMTLTWRMRSLPCGARSLYPNFIKSRLTTQGKLWAIQNGTLIWAYAYLTSIYDRENAFLDTYEVDVEFFLPEGVWHKADKQRTFLLPHDPCDMMECYDFRELQPCRIGDCCHCPSEDVGGGCNCCEPCDEVTKDQALCYNLDQIKDFTCGSPSFRAIYDCTAAEKFFGDFLSDERLGQRFCSTCGELLSGILYSETDVPTDNVKITIKGQVSNPYIEINGNGNYIKGDFDGVLEVYGNGQAYFGAEGCKPCEEVPVDAWVIPPGMDYGWMVEPGKNKLIVDGGSCCAYCVWVEVDALTF